MTVSLLQQKPGEYYRAGVAASVVAHLVLAYLVFFKLVPSMGDFPEPIVYSISIESGKSLGGVSQVPKDDKKSELAPVKHVTAPQEKAEKQQPEPVKPQDQKIEEAPNDAEVSTAEMKPTPKPLPTARPTAKPTVKPESTKKVSDKKDQETKKSDGENVDKRLQAALQRYLGESSEAGGKGFGAASVGGRGMGGGVVRPEAFFVYSKIIQSRIKDAWRWHDPNTALKTQVSFDIEPDGVVKNVRILRGSGESRFDDSVVRAVEKASPLPPPPESVYEQYFKKDVRVTFDPRE